MKSKKKNHKPVTENNLKKIVKNKEVILKLHTLNKEIERLRTEHQDAKGGEHRQRLQLLEKRVEELGGINAYQLSSKRGEALHGNLSSARWVLKTLREFNIRAEGSKLRLLDVGALSHNYTKQKQWIDCTPIDLNPQTSLVLKADFFTFQNDHPVLYDIIVLSLVLNFVGLPATRGEMLRRCCAICKPHGYLYIVLPRACLENSRYFSHDILKDIVESLGFSLKSSHNSRKLSFKMFTFLPERSDERKSFPKTIVRNGASCNNFSIVLRT